MQKNTNMIGWTVWILGACFFLTEYFVRVSTGVLSAQLLGEFNTDAGAIGLLSAYFYYAYISMQIPVGILVDRFGVRFLLSAATIMFGAACILFSHMSILQNGYLARFIMGCVGAFAFVGTLKLITIYFPANKFALLSGITQGGGMVGAIIGAAPMAYLFALIGWRASYTYFGSLFIGLGIVMYLLIRDRGHIHTKSKIKTNITADLKVVLSSPQTWLNCAFIGLMYAPTEIFGEQWGTLFCATTNHLTIEKAALQVSCIFIGMAIGCPLVGHISDKMKNRVKIMRFSSIACFAILLVIIYASAIGFNINYIIMCSIMFIYGIFNSAIIPSYAVATEIHGRHVSGVALGITNMATVVGGAILIPLIGHALDLIHTYTKGHVTIVDNSVSHFVSYDFYLAFTVLPLCFIICFMLTFLIKETHCISKE